MFIFIEELHDNIKTEVFRSTKDHQTLHYNHYQGTLTKNFF